MGGYELVAVPKVALYGMTGMTETMPLNSSSF